MKKTKPLKIVLAIFIAASLLCSAAYYKNYANTWHPFAKYEDVTGGIYDVFHKGTNDYRIDMSSRNYNKIWKFTIRKAIQLNQSTLVLPFVKDDRQSQLVIRTTSDTTAHSYIMIEGVRAFSLYTVTLPSGVTYIHEMMDENNTMITHQ